MIERASDRESRPLRFVLASVVGNALEWYDFFLFAAASALIFNRLFVPPEQGPTVGLLWSFGTYAVGFAARPLGGLLFGSLGDRRGRTVALLWTLSLMGGATFAIGLLPTYEQVGVSALVMLVVLRLAQGVAAGGEWGGGVLLIAENSAAERRGFMTAWSQAGVGLGFVMASLAFYAVRQLPDADFMSWGWRIPFLLSIVIVPVGLAIRRRLPESEEFTGAGAPVATPVALLIRRHPRQILAAIGVRLVENGGSHLMLAFALAYGHMVGVDSGVLLLGATLGMLADSAMMPVYGALSDRLGRRTVYAGGALALVAFGWPFFQMLASGSSLLVILAFVIGNGLCHAAMVGVQPTLFSELFDADVRYSGLSFAHEVSAVIVGWAPLAATALLAAYGSIGPVVALLAGLSAVSLLSLALLQPRPARG